MTGNTSSNDQSIANIKSPDKSSEIILIIDDEPSTLKLFCMFLRHYGYSPLQAEDGENGLRVFQEHYPRIVFTDIKMPGMDGIEVLKRIKKLAPHTEVIVITGHGDMDLAMKALQFDAADFINKPINRTEIEQALSRATQRIHRSDRSKKTIDVLFPQKGAAEILLHGNVNTFSEPYILEAYNKCLLQECSQLTFVFKEASSVNGAGINILGDVFKQAAKNNMTVLIKGLSPNFLKLFKEMGLLDMAQVKSD